jgi:hypothetical protein
MLRTTIAVVLVGRLALAPWALAQDAPAAGPIAAAAAREAARADPRPARGPLHTGLKWTGNGLLLHGAAVGTAGLIFCANDACGRNPEVGFGIAGASLIAGAVVLHVADRKRPPASPAIAVAEAEGPIAAAADREAARAATPVPPSMPPGLKWTGVSLLGASLLPITIAELGDCVPDGPACRRHRKAAYTAAGAMAGTGVLLLAIGGTRRDGASPLPSVSVGAGRVSITQRLTF